MSRINQSMVLWIVASMLTFASPVFAHEGPRGHRHSAEELAQHIATHLAELESRRPVISSNTEWNSVLPVVRPVP